MQVKLFNQLIEYKNRPSVIEDVFQHIDKSLEGSDYFFSHLTVDGIEVFEDHETYISEHIHEIEMIEVYVKTIREFNVELLLSAESYIKRAIPEINRVVDEFYQGPTESTWDKFEQILEAMQWILQMVETIDKNEHLPRNWEDFLRVTMDLKQEMLELESALKNTDYVLTADIIQYELVRLLQELEQEITNTIDNEGYRHDLN
jgi:hypothetical protein